MAAPAAINTSRYPHAGSLVDLIGSRDYQQARPRMDLPAAQYLGGRGQVSRRPLVQVPMKAYHMLAGHRRKRWTIIHTVGQATSGSS